MTIENATAATKLALLIDGDNVSATHMPIIMHEAEKHGGVAVRRIYGQFKSGKMKSWQKHIDEFDLTPVNVSPLTRGKNATDMKLVIEAMDMLHGRQLDGFCIASSDGDFTPLAARIRGNALAVYGFGAKKAPAAYKAEFDRFYECDTLLAAAKKPVTTRSAAPRATPKSKVVQPPSPKKGGQKPAAARPRIVAPSPAALPKEKILDVIDRQIGSSARRRTQDVGNAIVLAIPGFRFSDYGFGSVRSLVRSLDRFDVIKDGIESFVVRKNPA